MKKVLVILRAIAWNNLSNNVKATNMLIGQFKAALDRK